MPERCWIDDRSRSATWCLEMSKEKVSRRVVGLTFSRKSPCLNELALSVGLPRKFFELTSRPRLRELRTQTSRLTNSFQCQAGSIRASVIEMHGLETARLLPPQRV